MYVIQVSVVPEARNLNSRFEDPVLYVCTDDHRGE